MQNKKVYLYKIYNFFKNKINKILNFFFEHYYDFKNKDKPKLLFIGDSHARVFEYIKKKSFLNYYLNIIWVGGATAQGMVNPNSKTNALQIFQEKIKNNTYKHIFIQLGEVDCGFVIWYRAKKYSETIEFQMERSLKNYFSFVKWLMENKCKSIILTGAILPTIKDGVDWGGGSWQCPQRNNSNTKRKNISYS